MEPAIALAALILFAASLTRSTFGFGEALVAMPLLSMVVGVQQAAATVAMTSVCNAVVILSTTRWSEIEWPAATRLLGMGLLGVPMGVYGLVNIPASAVKFLLAAVVIAFAVYNLARPRLARLEGNGPAYLFGLVAGVLGGAYNTLGPALVIYGTWKQWPAQRFRMTLQAVFLPVSLTVIGFHYANGLWTPTVWACVVSSLPGIVVASLVGRQLNKRMNAARFSRYVCLLLLVIGGVLLYSLISDYVGGGATR